MENQISKLQQKEIKKILDRVPGFSKQGQLGIFFDKYLLCETLGRKIIYYKRNHRQKEKRNIKYESLNYLHIQSSLKFYSYKYQDNIIKEIFEGGKGIRGKKSSRQLRNGYLHNLSEEDRKEIEDRNSELINKMDRFINLF